MKAKKAGFKLRFDLMNLIRAESNEDSSTNILHGSGSVGAPSK
jgi:hypothetical protein